MAGAAARACISVRLAALLLTGGQGGLAQAQAQAQAPMPMPMPMPTQSQAAPAVAWSADARPALTGDLGLGAAWTGATAPGASAHTRVLPYAYADFGRLFVREDTFGVKLAPLGWGALELTARVSTEGADADGPGFAHRANPRPLGLGSFQETPWGGVFVDAFVDTVSGGSLLEASYAAQCALGPLTLYPQLGVARRSARYTAHLWGVSGAEAAAGATRAYVPGASTVPVFGLSGELPLAAHWVLVMHVQRERYDAAVRASPRVAASGQSSALLALAWRFS